MTEELMNLNTDLKDLFVQQKYEEMVTVLNEMPMEEVIELSNYNYEVIHKYYEAEKYDLIKQHLTFVAYCSFLFEYAVKNGLYTEAEYEPMNALFVSIFDLIKRK